MRKVLAASIAVLSMATLAACQPFSKPTTNLGASPQPSPAAPSGLAAIAEKIKAGQTFKCDVKAKDGSQAITYALKGDKVAMSMMQPAVGNTPAKEMKMVSDSTIMMIWDPATKQGMKMTIPSGESVAPPTADVPAAPKNGDLSTWENMQNEYDINCTPFTAGNAEFTPPTDVVFTDLSSMMAPNGAAAGTLPAGATMPSIPAEAQGMMPAYTGQ